MANVEFRGKVILVIISSALQLAIWTGGPLINSNESNQMIMCICVHACIIVPLFIVPVTPLIRE